MSKQLLDWIDKYDLEEVYGLDYETCLNMCEAVQQAMVDEVIEMAKDCQDGFEFIPVETFIDKLKQKYGGEGDVQK